MNTLNFNDADLKANREGRLSDAQAKQLDADIEAIQQHRYILFWSTRGLTDDPIQIVEGTAEIISTYRMVRGTYLPQHSLRLHRSWYRVFTFYFADAESLRYFENGKRYRVYYLSYAMPQALSAEEIHTEKTKNMGL